MDGSVKVGDFGLVTAITRPSRGKRKAIIIVLTRKFRYTVGRILERNLTLIFIMERKDKKIRTKY